MGQAPFICLRGKAVRWSYRFLTRCVRPLSHTVPSTETGIRGGEIMSLTQQVRAPIPITILYQGKATPIHAATTIDDDLWMTLPDLIASTGWEVKPEGICRDELCILVPDQIMPSLVHAREEETWFNLAGFARFLERPYARDDAHNVWSFGAMSEDGSSPGQILAPDFTLPDLDGKLHSLSSFRGKKVFLACWASW